jgi:hypothetical protein
MLVPDSIGLKNINKQNNISRNQFQKMKNKLYLLAG